MTTTKAEVRHKRNDTEVFTWGCGGGRRGESGCGEEEEEEAGANMWRRGDT